MYLRTTDNYDHIYMTIIFSTKKHNEINNGVKSSFPYRSDCAMSWSFEFISLRYAVFTNLPKLSYFLYYVVG